MTTLAFPSAFSLSFSLSPMIPPTCKRLIEVDFPIARVSAHSAKEKSIRHGHLSTLHLWWARRPLAACRAVLLGLLLPAPTDRECPADFKSKARVLLLKRHTKPLSTDQELQDDLLAFIAEFADWDNAGNALYLEIGRGLVKAAHPEETPVIVDPFAGGGSIPLEALRLGCEAFASDLNPVACLILKTLLEDIPRYGNAEFKLADGKGKETVVHGLADALRHIGKQVKEATEKELAQFYPPDPDGSRPIAYLWARTVRCEGIGCGAEISLMGAFWLCKKTKRKVALRFQVERIKGKTPRVVFEIFEPKPEEAVTESTVNRANATCLCCGIVLPAERVRSQLAEQRGGGDVMFDAKGKRTGGAVLLAVVTAKDGVAERQYRLATDRDYAAVFASQRAVVQQPQGALPHEPTPMGGGKGAGRAFSVQKYGLASFTDLFTARQRLTLATLASKALEIANFAAKTAHASAPLRECLSLSVSKQADYLSTLCTWHYHNREKVNHTFARQGLPFITDFAETVFCGNGSGCWDGLSDWTAMAVERTAQLTCPGAVQLADARRSPLSSGTSHVWFTDPPYYDAVPYSDLSDFFLVWLKRALPQHPLLRDPFDKTNALSPKTPELVQDETRRVGGGVKDKDFFERGMSIAFAEGRRVLRDDGIACVVFAHKTTEGWEALLSGILKAGLTITASWPIATEMATALRAKESAALATSVHLVCRPRPENAGVGDWTEVKAAMGKRIREWLPMLLKHGVRGADAIFSCLGPALESYSRYERVLTAADREVPLGGAPDATEPHERGFLAYVFEAVSKEAMRQVLGDAETEGFEEDARLTALFLWTLQATKTNGTQGKAEGSRLRAEGDNEEEQEEPGEEDQNPKKPKAGFTMPFDTFIRITRPMGIHYPALEGRVLEIEKGVVRLLPIKERTEELLGEAAQRPGIEISLEDFRQLELGLVEKKRTEAALPTKPKKGKQATPGRPLAEATFTTLDRIHRAMLLFSMGRSTLLRQVLETEMRQGKRFERLALALNALYPDGSEERRMLEGVQAAMRGVR